MITNALKLAACALVPAALLTFTSCSTALKGTEQTSVLETPDGAMIVDTYTIIAKVTAINATKGTVTLSEGKRSHTYKVGSDVNLGRLHIGDSVTATLTEEVAIALRKPGTPPSAGEGAAVALARNGATRAEFMADTVQMTATITALDAKARKVTLKFEDGTSKTLRVGKNADLNAVNVGDAVTLQAAEAVAISVTKA